MIFFKYPQLKLEFEGLSEIEKRLVRPELLKLLYFLEGYCTYNFNKSIIITELLRSRESQDRYYRNNPAYEQNPWQSPHQFGCAADIRSAVFEPEEIDDIIAIVNRWFPYDNSGKSSAIYHDIGKGAHIHLQVKPE
ncbi:hypothetical protein ISS30_01735 [bacterium]|nr:hypothetical protein [FCB group bacterium]MBL7190387.1 hypothetical protein [bacterium]